MSFQTLRVDELKEVADFFLKDVEAADPEKGPTKKELVAALASGDPDSETDAPVTWKQYQEIFLVSKQNEPKETEPDDTISLVVAAPAEPVDKSDWQLVKMERQNPTYEVYGFVFTKKHPYQNVPPEIAVKLIRQQEGFRLALADELADYYA